MSFWVMAGSRLETEWWRLGDVSLILDQESSYIRNTLKCSNGVIRKRLMPSWTKTRSMHLPFFWYEKKYLMLSCSSGQVGSLSFRGNFVEGLLEGRLWIVFNEGAAIVEVEPFWFSHLVNFVLSRKYARMEINFAETSSHFRTMSPALGKRSSSPAPFSVLHPKRDTKDLSLFARTFTKGEGRESHHFKTFLDYKCLFKVDIGDKEKAHLHIC